MYLSRVEIDVNNRVKIKDLSHIGAFHNWVESSFPEEFDIGVRTRKLWRIDRLNNKEYLLIVSETKPSLEHLELYGVEGTAKVKDYDHFLDQIEEGKSYRFRVTLNPVVAQMSGERGKRGKVSPVYNYEQIKFLNDRSKKNGFNLNENEFYIINRGHVSLKRAGHREVNLNKAIYEGRLTVVDKNTFIRILTKGLGKKKAYGFGMMTVIPEK